MLATLSGAAKKIPNPHNISIHNNSARGSGHHGFIDLTGGSITAVLFMCHGDQEMLRAGRARVQHGLYHDALRGFAVGRHHDVFLGAAH